MLLAQCCEDDIVPHILPFVKLHIKSPDWRFRDAACMAFGSILEGPERSKWFSSLKKNNIIFTFYDVLSG